MEEESSYGSLPAHHTDKKAIIYKILFKNK